MDIKETVESLVSKITENKDLLAKFKSDPKETVKGLIKNVNLDDETLEKIVELVKAKIGSDGFLKNVDTASIKSALGGLFGKK